MKSRKSWQQQLSKKTWAVWLMLVSITPQAVLGQDGVNHAIQNQGQLEQMKSSIMQRFHENPASTVTQLYYNPLSATDLVPQPGERQPLTAPVLVIPTAEVGVETKTEAKVLPAPVVETETVVEVETTPVMETKTEVEVQPTPVVVTETIISSSTLLSQDESQRITTAIVKAEQAEVKLSKKIKSCWVRMQNMRATITEIKEIQVDINTVAYELRDRQGKLLGRVVKVNDQLDRVEGELGYLVDDLMAAAEQMGLLNENLNLLTSDVGELNCMLKQLGCNLQQLQCALSALQCDLCALDKAIRAGQFKAFIIGVLVGIGIGAAIGGGGGAVAGRTVIPALPF